MVPTRTVYVWGDGRFWKFQGPQLRLVAQGVWWADAGRMLRNTHYDYRTGVWRNLPEGVTQSAEFERPWAWKNGIEVVDMDDASEFFDELFGR